MMEFCLHSFHSSYLISLGRYRILSNHIPVSALFSSLIIPFSTSSVERLEMSELAANNFKSGPRNAKMENHTEDVIEPSSAEMNNKKYPNFFNAPERVPFPAPVDGDVDTVEFFRAVEDYVKFFQNFGLIFKLVIQEAVGQLEALRKIYSEYTEESKTLRSMLEAEKKRKEGKAAIELLWLLRYSKYRLGDPQKADQKGLEFYSKFLELMQDNVRLPPAQRKDIGGVAAAAYDVTLVKYHGFFTRNATKLAYKTAFYGDTINQRLWYSSEAVDEAVLYADARKCSGALPDVVLAIEAMYKALDLDTSSRAP